MNVTPNRTPSPWEVYNGGHDICHNIAGHVATCEDVEDAAYIVKAVNAHDKLVIALRLAKQEMDYQRTYRKPERIDRDRFDALARDFEAALAAAGEPT